MTLQVFEMVKLLKNGETLKLYLRPKQLG